MEERCRNGTTVMTATTVEQQDQRQCDDQQFFEKEGYGEQHQCDEHAQQHQRDEQQYYDQEGHGDQHQRDDLAQQQHQRDNQLFFEREGYGDQHQRDDLAQQHQRDDQQFFERDGYGEQYQQRHHRMMQEVWGGDDDFDFNDDWQRYVRARQTYAELCIERDGD